MSDNELIAEFMGFQFLRDSPEYGRLYTHPDHMGQYGGLAMPFKYDISWDWLMPAVEKWNNISVKMQRKLPKYKDLDDATGWRAWSYRYIHLSTNQPVVYRQLVESIKWYNDLPK